MRASPYLDRSNNATRPEDIALQDREVQGYQIGGSTAGKRCRTDHPTLDGQAHCDYAYVRMGTAPTTRKLDLAAPPVTVAHQTFAAGGAGDAEDKYTGLDRFGRIAETHWKDGASMRATPLNVHYGTNGEVRGCEIVGKTVEKLN